MERIEKTLRNWVVDVMKGHRNLLRIAFAQRSKFERWRLLEVASHAEQSGAAEIALEGCSQSGGRRQLCDLTFTFNDKRHKAEFKTANTNWRVAGALNRTRPITLNIEGIIRDARKFREQAAQGLVLFVLFPLPAGDVRWHRYLDRIGNAVEIQLSERTHCARVEAPLGAGDAAEAVVCCFAVGQVERG